MVSVGINVYKVPIADLVRIPYRLAKSVSTARA